MQPKVREYLTQLRKTAFLQIKPGYCGYRRGARPEHRSGRIRLTLKPETVTKAEVEQKTRHKRLLWVIPIPGTEDDGRQARAVRAKSTHMKSPTSAHLVPNEIVTGSFSGRYRKRFGRRKPASPISRFISPTDRRNGSEDVGQRGGGDGYL